MLNWIVIGIGDIATKRVIPAIQLESRSRLYGFVTRDPAKGASYGVRVWPTLDEALKDPAVHAVYVGTPVFLHAPQTIQALRSGKKTPYLDPSLKDVPVNFLSTVDTTGGNSGSPTLNSRGELVDLLFDGTYESVASNFLFDPVTTRSIHVDTRYMLWNMAEVDGADNLIKELTIVSRSGAATQK